MDLQVLLLIGLIAAIALGAIAVFLLLRMRGPGLAQSVAGEVSAADEARHRQILTDLHDGLARQGDRLAAVQNDASERLRGAVGTELTQTRDRLHTFERNISGTVLEKLAEQSRANQTHLQTSLEAASRQITATLEALTKGVDVRLGEISGKVNERLDEGFKKTNETFVSVMTRLQTIDDAQKKIETLTTSVVSLQEVLGDKRSRGAFGEVQLSALVANVMPVQTYEMQYTLPNGMRADCVLKLPEPTGMVVVDSKFPLENYHRMFDETLGDPGKTQAATQFKRDVKTHVDAIATKYIVAGVTSDGAMMFVPAEAVFAEIHARHPEVVDYANAKRVWIVSPTTLMAVLNTARAVMKDVETRKQVHIIKDELGKLGADFGRFQSRMDNLARHIDQAKKDVDEVHVSSRKISDRFARIERVELEAPASHADQPEPKLIPSDPDAANGEP